MVNMRREQVTLDKRHAEGNTSLELDQKYAIGTAYALITRVAHCVTSPLVDKIVPPPSLVNCVPAINRERGALDISCL